MSLIATLVVAKGLVRIVAVAVLVAAHQHLPVELSRPHVDPEDALVAPYDSLPDRRSRRSAAELDVVAVGVVCLRRAENMLRSSYCPEDNNLEANQGYV